MQTNLELQMAAKAKRDAVRGAIVRVLNSMDNLPSELTALLKADKMVEVEFQAALNKV